MYEPILSVESIQQCDRECIDKLDIAELTLMENAGCAVFESIKKSYSPIQEKHFLIVCGKGNNAGDGLVVARKLLEENAKVDVLLTCEKEDLKGSTAENLLSLQKLTEQKSTGQKLTGQKYKIQIHVFNNHQQLNKFSNAEIIVDAIFGTGLNKNVKEPYSSLIDWINEESQQSKQKKVIAVDIPSGINGNTGQLQGSAAKADLTVTFAAKKLGLLLEDGQEHSGKLEVADIGIPQAVLAKNSGLYNSVWSINDSLVSSWLPKRSWRANKYSNGLSFIVAGSTGLSGAAYLCSQAAALIGAGAVICACPKTVQPVLATKLTEVMTFPIAETEQGTVASLALKEIEDKSYKANAILIGPGLGRHTETVDFVNEFVLQNNKPMVIDADALYSLSVGDALKYQNIKLTNKILTPHWGEFKRLIALDADLTYFQKIAEAKKYAEKWDCVILLKGFPSIVALPSGKCFINQSGNPVVSSAGHGDVLAGICVGLLSQGLNNEQATLAAVYIAGCVADDYIVNCGLQNMLATKILETLPNILKQRFT